MLGNSGRGGTKNGADTNINSISFLCKLRYWTGECATMYGRLQYRDENKNYGLQYTSSFTNRRRHIAFGGYCGVGA